MSLYLDSAQMVELGHVELQDGESISGQCRDGRTWTMNMLSFRTVSLYLESAQMVELGHVELQDGESLPGPCPDGRTWTC